MCFSAMTITCSAMAAVCHLFVSTNSDYIRSLKYSREVVYTRPGLGFDLFGMERCVFLCLSTHTCTSHQFFSCKTRQ